MRFAFGIPLAAAPNLWYIDNIFLLSEEAARRIKERFSLQRRNRVEGFPQRPERLA